MVSKTKSKPRKLLSIDKPTNHSKWVVRLIIDFQLIEQDGTNNQEKTMDDFNASR